MTGTHSATSPGGASTPRPGAPDSARRDEDKRGTELSEHSNDRPSARHPRHERAVTWIPWVRRTRRPSTLIHLDVGVRPVAPRHTGKPSALAVVPSDDPAPGLTHHRVGEGRHPLITLLGPKACPWVRESGGISTQLGHHLHALTVRRCPTDRSGALELGGHVPVPHERVNGHFQLTF
jgi:hypothetical protein